MWTLSSSGLFPRWLGVTSVGVPEHLNCSHVPLSPRQKSLCQKKFFLLPSIQDGARLAISECQNQFRHERWNCSTSQNPSVFGQELTSGESSSCRSVQVQIRFQRWLTPSPDVTPL